jgi:hypothetical protein
MLHACVQKFDVTENLEKFYKILGTKQGLSFHVSVVNCLARLGKIVVVWISLLVAV